MLLLQNLLNPDYGMIKEDDESNLSWFRDSDDNSEMLFNIVLEYCLCFINPKYDSERN